jgi:hypothetical protein
MADQFEPKSSIGRILTSVVLWVGLIGMAGYLVFLYDASEKTDILGPGMMRKVVNNYRLKRRNRLVRKANEVRQNLRAMRKIRDRRFDAAEVPRETAADVLSGDERKWRETADAPLEGKRFHEVYNTIRAMEQEMITLYREFLAARTLVVNEGYSYRDAYGNSNTQRTERPLLDQADLYREITEKGEDLKRFKKEIRKATIETREMLLRCQELLEFTRKQAGQTGSGISVDVTGDDIAMIGYNGPELMPDEINDMFRYDLGSFRAIPGRRLTSTTPSGVEWMYVDSWYIIGPFKSDRRRQNLDVRWGPEANVNLDDVFTGKGGKKLRWRYKKVGHAGNSDQAFWKIEPKHVVTYGIWYAFTEIYSNAPRTVWIATGTDDYGKLWINDKLVWKSPKERKPYNATENLQSVELKQGQNKILYRIENAGGTMGFSLLMRLGTGG